jgi:hypothetical protein
MDEWNATSRWTNGHARNEQGHWRRTGAMSDGSSLNKCPQQLRLGEASALLPSREVAARCSS